MITPKIDFCFLVRKFLQNLLRSVDGKPWVGFLSAVELDAGTNGGYTAKNWEMSSDSTSAFSVWRVSGAWRRVGNAILGLANDVL